MEIEDEAATKPPQRSYAAKTASVHSVSHINGYAKDGAAASTVSPTELFANLAAGKQHTPPMQGFVRNPAIVKTEVAALLRDLDHYRDGLDGAGRLALAEDLKASTNAHFSEGKWRVAIVGYSLAIWLLRREERPPCPFLVAHALSTGKVEGPEHTAALDELAATLASVAEPAAPVVVLWASLHLNLAAAALKVDAWAAARVACERILAADATNAKALFRHAQAVEPSPWPSPSTSPSPSPFLVALTLQARPGGRTLTLTLGLISAPNYSPRPHPFRLAKALEGEGELARAVGVATSLVKGDAGNGEARRLLQTLRERQGEEKSMFKGKLLGQG